MQGHDRALADYYQLSSSEMLRGLDDSSAPAFAVHGARLAHYNSIRTEGLRRGKRSHIHFVSGNVADAARSQDSEVSGLRASAEILLWISIRRCFRQGIEFFEAPNGVILSPGRDGYIPPDCIAHVQLAHNGAKVAAKGGHHLPTNADVQSAMHTSGGQRTPRRTGQKMLDRRIPPACVSLHGGSLNRISHSQAYAITVLIVNKFMRLSTESVAQAGSTGRRPAGTSTACREGILQSKQCMCDCPSCMCSNRDKQLAADGFNRCPSYLSWGIIAGTQLRHTSCSVIMNKYSTDHHSVPSCFEFHQLARRFHFILASCTLTTSFVSPHSPSQMPSPSSKSMSARRLPTRIRTADAQEEPTGAWLELQEAAVAKAKARPSVGSVR